MKRFSFAVAALSILVSASCSKPENESPDVPRGFKVALIVENTVDDKGWCQAMYDGLVSAQQQLDNAFIFKVAEKTAPADAGRAARQFAADGFSLIIAHGAQYKNLILEIAGDYPEVSFAYGTASEIGPANVFTYMPESEETGYLSGLIAGQVTKSNIVGLVGSVDGGDAARYNRGYVMGVRKANPSAKILVERTGSFADYVKAGDIAASQIENGADVLTGSSQQAIGALRSCMESSDALWIGQNIAQIGTPEGQKKCLAASSYNYAAVVIDLYKKIHAEKLGGEIIPMNFNNGGFIFEFNPALNEKMPAEVKKSVEDQIASMRETAGLLRNYTSID